MASEGAPTFDVLVVGAGHAGIEAALAACRLGARVGMVTLRLEGIGQMSCNPAIGGVGKGHLVREIDALGGAMAQVADATGTQFRRLNGSRGPAVRATRCQSDAVAYRRAMRARLEATPGLTLLCDEVVDLVVGPRGIVGAVGRRHGALRAGAVIITTGTFLNGLCHVGEAQFVGGREGDGAAAPLAAALRRVGVVLRRFKTGTTPRLAADSVDWELLARQDGDVPAPRFAFEPVGAGLPQRPCFIAFTNPDTHAIVRAGLPRSPLYGGIIEGTGPRYCPSLEDKVVRFAERSRHQVFLEFESAESDRVYPNGLSTSLPRELQEAFLRSMVGLTRAQVLSYGYAVEYDYAPPTQLGASLMLRQLPGLFLAGQINGTSGYEEAAAQGLMAGLNAARFLAGQPPAVLGRDEAYIGVLVDDLVSRGVDEPYRMFTSRAEYRLTLRESNAEARLAARAAQWGLVDAGRQQRAAGRAAALARWRAEVRQRRLDGPTLARLGWPVSDCGLLWEDALRRPQVTLAQLLGPPAAGGPAPPPAALGEQLEEELKYAGYIAREQRAMARLRDVEACRLPPASSYRQLPGLSAELQQRLAAVQPETLGQASRMVGMTPAALALLRFHAARLRGAAAAALPASAGGR